MAARSRQGAARAESPREAMMRPPLHGNRAPRSTAEMLRSTSMPTFNTWPDPTPEPRAPTPRIPVSTQEQQQSTSMLFSREYAAPGPASERSTRSNPRSTVEQNASSVFGTPQCKRPPTQQQTFKEQAGDGWSRTVLARGAWMLPTPRNAADGAAKSSAAQQVSTSLPGTSWAAPPRPPPSAAPGYAAVTTAEQLRSSSLPSTHHEAPRQVTRSRPANPRSLAEQNTSTVFGTPRHATPTTPAPKPTPSVATDSVAQNASSVFGTPRYQRAPSSEAILSKQSGSGWTRKTFEPGAWLLPTPRQPWEGAASTKGAQQVSTTLPGTAWAAPAPRPPSAPPGNAASTKAEQNRSTVFGTPRHVSPPALTAPKREELRAMTNTKAGRNCSSVFPGQSVYVPPARPVARGPSKIATTTLEQ